MTTSPPDRNAAAGGLGGRPSRAVIVLAGLGLLAVVAAAIWWPASRDADADRPVTLRIGRARVPQSLEPQSVEFLTLETTSNVYEGLVRHDSYLVIEPALAVSWASPDTLTWVFELRKGVSFHDGTPLTAAHVHEAIAAVIAAPEARGKQWLASVSEVDVVGEAAVRLRTHAPEPLLLQRLARFKIVRRTSSGARVGTGPYRVARFRPGEELELAAFDPYWGPAPEASRVSYVSTAGSDAASALADGSIDAATFATLPTVDSETLRVLSGRTLTRMFLWFGASPEGTEAAPLADRRVRQAVALAVDRARISSRITGDPGFAAHQLVPGHIFGHDPGIAVSQQDQEAARRLLAEAGWPDGFDVPLIYPETGRRYRWALEVLEPMLQEVGIRTRPQAVPMDEVLARFRGAAVGLIFAAWTYDDGDAGSFLRDCIHSRGGQGRGMFNPGFSDPSMDRLIDRALAELDPQERLIAYQELMRLANDLVPTLPLSDHAVYYAVRRPWSFAPRADSLLLAAEFKRSDASSPK